MPRAVTRNARRLAALLAVAALLLLGAFWMRGGGPRVLPAPAVGQGPRDEPGASVSGVLPEVPSASRRAEVPAPAAAEAPAPVLRGRVVEADTGRGVPGALVGGRLALNQAFLAERAGDRTLPDDVARTSAQGEFSLTRIADDVEQLVATHFDYAPAAAPRPPQGWGAVTPVVIRVARGPHVYGTARTDGGQPAAGVWVRVFGRGWPRGVLTTTDDEGAYRTPAVHPGPIDVIATPPPGAAQGGDVFTREQRSTVIGSLDLRVDFGPSAEHVTWRGRVLDERGEALEEGQLVVLALDGPGQADPSRPERRVVHFGGGAFELGKLRAGVTYGVTLRLEGAEAPLEAGEVRFEAPGLAERDLRLAADHVILGTVVDRDSGEPVTGGGAVSARRSVSVFSESRSVRLDERGRFLFRGLPAGRYDLYVSAEGYAATRLEDLPVGGEEGPLAPLRVEVARGASLRVRLEGFEPGLAFSLAFEGHGTTRTGSGSSTDEEGRFEASVTLLAGSWTVHLTAPGVGRAEREVALPAGGLGEVLFLPADLERFEGQVAVEGTLTRASGTPEVGARVFLYAVDVELAEGEGPQRVATTDPAGRFRAEGFAPGRWFVSAILADGAEVQFDDLLVPPRPPDPLFLPLVVPEGRVRGRLHDAATGAPLAADGPAWWAFLRDPVSENVVAELQGGHRGSAFELVGVPPGRYRLLVLARGFFDHHSAPFDVGSGEALDLGLVELEPSAVLEVEVLGPDGAPVGGFTVAVDGARLAPWDAYDPGPGRARWDGLPAGTASVTVSAKGMLPDERAVTLRIGEVSQERFELAPE